MGCSDSATNDPYLRLPGRTGPFLALKKVLIRPFHSESVSGKVVTRPNFWMRGKTSTTDLMKSSMWKTRFFSVGANMLHSAGPVIRTKPCTHGPSEILCRFLNSLWSIKPICRAFCAIFCTGDAPQSNPFWSQRPFSLSIRPFQSFKSMTKIRSSATRTTSISRALPGPITTSRFV